MHEYTSKDPDFRPKKPSEVFRWAIWDRLTGRRKISPPGPGAPCVEPDLERIRNGSEDLLTWIGHASFLVRLGGRNVLIDPVMASKVGPFRRHSPPGLLPRQLPAIDLLLVTHSHYDHLDTRTLRRLDRTIPVRVPLGLRGFFRRRGFRDVEELDWWQTTTLPADKDDDGLRVTSVPARHWSSRLGPIDINSSLWGGFVVEGGGRCVYHAGDTGWFERFPEIGERFPELDVAMLPIGAYDPPWFMSAQHIDPEEAGRAFLQLGARRLVPMHWGAFQLSDERLGEPPERLRAFFAEHAPEHAEKVHILSVGESLGF